MRLDSSLILACVLLGSVLVWTVRKFSTASPFRNLPGPPSPSFLKGNIQQLSGRHSNEWVAHLAETYGALSKITGPFGRPWLHVYDPKALYSITIKDQDIWLKNNTVANLSLLGPGLLVTAGAQHRKQRKMLTPVFSIAYLRSITSVFYETTFKLRDGLIADIQDGPKEIDILGWMGRAALELVGQGALGYSFDPLVEDVHNDFAEAVKSFFAIALWRSIAFPVLVLGSKLLPPQWADWIADVFPSKRVQRMRYITRTMKKRSEEIIAEKRAALQEGDRSTLQQVAQGKDIMSILCNESVKANMAASQKEQLSNEELTAQISTFILAGMDTTSNATARLLYLLAENPSVQKRLREEILEAQAGEEISYDQLNELPFLDSVCRETLRLYVSVPRRILNIICRPTVDTVLPLHEPIRGEDGSLITEVAVPKGTVAVLNLWACNTNKSIWGEDAYEWKPDRFLSPLPRTVEEARIPGVYSNLMSFHGGSRSCIGFKYAQLELKVVLSVLVANFNFELSDKEIVWNNAGVAYPTVGKESSKPEMPLKVSVIRS
ncbi:cytochrome P450 [Dichomitus squalens]|uniref:Cytochrome P450 n=1 Tax=Dichomitus squalens TaxID=114155 RepID=A0A4Q9PT58_9APHY|nr:cytochrome P450 [Dichomitus squalens]TBU57652.1 cytochrome P450 [Dichomitus squalens]